MSNAEAMVTARMGIEKKEEGNRILSSLGTNASKAINQLFDYVIEKRALPFDANAKKQQLHSQAEIESAISLVDGLVIPVVEPYRSMSLKEAKSVRLGIANAAEEER